MSFGVIVNTRTALPARGPITRSDTAFLACKTADGPDDKVTDCRSILDFEAVYGPRAGLSVETWDWLDTAFRSGLRRAKVARYATNYTDAFDLFGTKKGDCGQLVVLGETPGTTLYDDMRNYAMSSNKVALRDVNMGSTIDEMCALGDEAPSGDEYGATFGSWVQVPAPAGVYGANSRNVQASAVMAGTIALVDADGNPNRAAAGDDFAFRYATGIVNNPNDVDRARLFQHGVNAFGNPFDVMQPYGFQTNIPQSDDTPFWQFNPSRGRMYLKARAEVRGQKYMFRDIDGQGHEAGSLKNDLLEEFAALWDLDGLFGATPAEAYAVEVGEVINTVDEIAQGHLHAVGAARFSLHTKAVFIDLVSIPITGSTASA